jgi:hypothetical protein
MMMKSAALMVDLALEAECNQRINAAEAIRQAAKSTADYHDGAGGDLKCCTHRHRNRLGYELP